MSENKRLPITKEKKYFEKEHWVNDGSQVELRSNDQETTPSSTWLPPNARPEVKISKGTDQYTPWNDFHAQTPIHGELIYLSKEDKLVHNHINESVDELKRFYKTLEAMENDSTSPTLEKSGLQRYSELPLEKILQETMYPGSYMNDVLNKVKKQIIKAVTNYKGFDHLDKKSKAENQLQLIETYLHTINDTAKINKVLKTENNKSYMDKLAKELLTPYTHGFTPYMDKQSMENSSQEIYKITFQKEESEQINPNSIRDSSTKKELPKLQDSIKETYNLKINNTINK